MRMNWRENGLFSSRHFSFNERDFISVSIDCGRTVLRKTASVGSWSIRRVDFTIEHSEHCRLLPAMMCGVRDSANHHPRATTHDAEEGYFMLPPLRRLGGEDSLTFQRIRSIPLNKTESRFFFGKRRSADINPEDVPKPKIFAQALVDHLLAHAPAAFVGGMRPKVHVFVAKHAPYTNHFQPFRPIGADQKVVILH